MRKPKQPPSLTVEQMLRDADAIVRDRRVSFEVALQTAMTARFVDTINAASQQRGAT